MAKVQSFFESAAVLLLVAGFFTLFMKYLLPYAVLITMAFYVVVALAFVVVLILITFFGPRGE